LKGRKKSWLLPLTNALLSLRIDAMTSTAFGDGWPGVAGVAGGGADASATGAKPVPESAAATSKRMNAILRM
jgi:hypothetical protein